jgi:hypothetical protein
MQLSDIGDLPVIAQIRALLDAGRATAQTVGGLITPPQTLAPGTPDNPLEFFQEIGSMGLPGAIEAAQQRFQDSNAPAWQKFGVETAFDPLTYLGGPLGKGAGLGAKAATSAGIPALPELLKAAQLVDQGYTRGTGKVIQVAQDALSGLTKNIPFLQLAPAAKLAAYHDNYRDTINAVKGLMGEDLPATQLFSQIMAGQGTPEFQAAIQAVRPRLQQIIEEGAQTSGSTPNTVSKFTKNISNADAARLVESAVTNPQWSAETARTAGTQTAALIDRYKADVTKLAEGLNFPALAPANLDEAAKLAQGNEAALKTIDQMRKFWGIDPLDAGVDEAITVRHMADMAKELGVKFQDSNALRQSLAGWKQLALTTPRFNLQNLTDEGLKNLLYLGHTGFVDLGGMLKDALRAISKTATGETVSPSTERLAGQALGPDAQQFLDQAELQAFPRSTLAATHGHVITPEMSQARGLENAPIIGGLIRFSQEVADAIDQSARMGTFMHGYKEALKAGVSDLQDKVAQELTAQGVDPTNALKALDMTDGFIGPTRMSGILNDAGANSEVQARVLAELNQSRAEAWAAGNQLSSRIHFDPRMVTPLDQKLGNVMAFHYWASRNIPFYLQTFLQKPGLFEAFRRYRDAAQANAEQQGIHRPGQEDAVPLGGFGDLLMQALVGRNGEAYLNPEQYIGILGQLFQNTNDRSGENPVVGRFLDTAQQLGMSPNPLIATAINASGAEGAHAPTSFVPTVEPLVKNVVQATTGQQVQTPLDQLQIALQALGGRPAFDPERAARLRLGEQSIEQTGQTNNPAMIAAARLGQASPAFNSASQQAGTQRLAEQLLSLAGLPITFRGNTQAAIEQANAPIQQSTADMTPAQRVANAQRNEVLRQVIASLGRPEVLGYQDFIRKPTDYSQLAPSDLRNAVLNDYRYGDAATRAAMTTNPQVMQVLLLQALTRGMLQNRTPLMQTVPQNNTLPIG